MWVLVIVCASGVSCGLHEPITKLGMQSFEHCHSVAELGIELMGVSKDKFRIICASEREK